jgi:predicted nucleic acid-binding protein
VTSYLLDTNVIAELRKGSRANSGVTRWFERHAGDDLWLSVLVVAELRRGANRIRRRNPAEADQLDSWLDALEASFADRILPVTLDVVRRWAAIGIRVPFPVVDGLLVATAITHGLTLVTRNAADIERSHADWENPFL